MGSSTSLLFLFSALVKDYFLGLMLRGGSSRQTCSEFPLQHQSKIPALEQLNPPTPYTHRGPSEGLDDSAPVSSLLPGHRAQLAPPEDQERDPVCG